MSKKQIELMVCNMCHYRYTKHKESKSHQWTCSECGDVRVKLGGDNV